MKRILCSLLVATLPFGSVLADAPKSKNAKVTLVYQHELPSVPGKSIKGVLVEYGPGGYSPAHTHPESAFIYATVLEGAIRSQVNDGLVTTYKAGQSFSELPGDRHGVSANASKTKPAKLLAVFVMDTNETELTIPFGNLGTVGQGGKSFGNIRQPPPERPDIGSRSKPRVNPSGPAARSWPRQAGTAQSAPTPRRSNPSGSAWSSSQFRPSGHASLGSTSQA
jgi:quercetin dioxygenase-like cupin family protein